MYDFRFKPFEEMTDEDYEKVGFKSGLEIHQQLLTEKKLFCRCPAGMFNKNYDAEILRHMRPTLSELGEYDGTALMEFKTKKEIIYRINRQSVCTYEMDDTPPFLINEQALEIALETGLLYGCNIVDELHIARKQYLDGSIPTGFQRTAIFALNGKIPYKDREIEIVQMSIEEDSCREVSDVGHRRVYITDRLGMPLIETVTGPDMRTPQEVAEVALLCANIVRSTNKVRRGAGAAREDVNVSVTGGTRIEIKGVPKISRIPRLTYNEAMRQWNLLRLREELKKRNITEETFGSSHHDITKLMKKPHYLPIKTAVENGEVIKAVVLKGFAGLLNWQTQTNTYFSKEISDRVRVIACLTTIPNIIHSDSKGDNLTSFEWFDVLKNCSATENDSVVIVWGSEEDTNTAVKEIIIRAKEATIGIPSETRQALRDGTNGFERILPGADRMYPDTDLPPKEITSEVLDDIRQNLDRPYFERIKWYKELGVPKNVISNLAVSPYTKLFRKSIEEYDLDPKFVSRSLTSDLNRLKKLNRIEQFDEDNLDKALKLVRDKKLSHSGIFYYLQKTFMNTEFNFDENSKLLSEDEIKKTAKEIIGSIDDTQLHNAEKKNEITIGIVMKKIALKAEGKTVREVVESILNGGN